MAESVWAARVTWQVATLAIVAFLVGAVSVIPWKAAAAAGGAADIALVLLLPLVALLAALGLGLFVAGRVRRATLGGLSSMAAQVRAAAETGRSPVSDPLGTRASSELAEAINEVLERAARP